MLFFLLGARVAHAEWEGATFGVEDYNGTGLCCYGCDDLEFPKNDAAWVRDGLMNIGFDQVQLNQDGGVDGRDWMDNHVHAIGDDNIDPYGTDFANVVFYSGHGSCSCGPNYYSEIVMGDDNPGEACLPNTKTHIRLANGGDNEETQVMILAACQSMQYCVWQNGGYSSVDAGGSGDRFTTYDGFHGLSYDYSDLQSQLKSYVEDSENNGIGANWVADLTDLNYFSDDQCATTMIRGSSSSTRDNQYSNGGFQDPKDTGSHTGSTFYYICGCDPDDGEVLPSC